jgi:hypothetical protein
MTSLRLNREDDADTFWQKLILPEEDRLHLYPHERWKGGYRWFRSPNVIPIERIRRDRQRRGNDTDTR